jgi:hypothetical protein
MAAAPSDPTGMAAAPSDPNGMASALSDPNGMAAAPSDPNGMASATVTGRDVFFLVPITGLPLVVNPLPLVTDDII